VCCAGPATVVAVAGPKDVADGSGVFMFMHTSLPREQLQTLIDNSVEAIDILDVQTPQNQTKSLKKQASESAQNLGPAHRRFAPNDN
jgi:hypothetical protein